MAKKLQVFSIQAHAKVFRFYGEKCLKRILKYLYCTKYNKINIYHFDIHKNIFHTKWHKYYKCFVHRVTQKFSNLMG